MKTSLALTILKVEGIGEQIDCQIFQDDFFLKSISLQDTQINENFIEFSKKGVLSLIVKSALVPYQKYTVSMNIEALPLEGAVWLPLYSNSSGEVLPSIPSMLPSTRVLVSINTLSLLTPVPELNESDSSVFDIENSLNKDENENRQMRLNYEKCKKALMIVNEKNKELRIKYCELQNQFEKVSEEIGDGRIKESHECFTKLAVQLERYKLHCGNLQCINEENLKRIQALQGMLDCEVEQRKLAENELQIIMNESKEYIESSEKKFKHYEETIRLKNDEIQILKSSKPAFAGFEKLLESGQRFSALHQQLQDTLEKLQDSEKSRNTLQLKLETSAQHFSKELEDLFKAPTDSISKKLEESLKELKKYRQKCSELENLLDDKYLDIKLGSESKAEKIITELREQLRIEKELNEGLLEQTKEKHLKEIGHGFKGADEKFVEYLKIFGIEEKFSRVSDGVFAYSNKKVTVAIRNGTLVVRVGGGYMGIDQFVKNFMSGAEEVLTHKRSQTSILHEKGVKEDISRKVSDKKMKSLKIGTVAKENLEDVKYTKVLTSKSLTKSLTPSRDCLLKRVFK